MESHLLATVVAALGLSSGVIAQTGDVPTAVAPYVGASSAAAAVAGLVYLGRKMSNGQLVAADTQKLLNDNQRTIDGLMRVIDEQRLDKQEGRELLREAIAMQRETNQLFGRYGNIIEQASR